MFPSITVSVTGNVNCDDCVDIRDLVSAKKCLANPTDFNEVQKVALCITGKNDPVDADLAALRRILLTTPDDVS